MNGEVKQKLGIRSLLPFHTIMHFVVVAVCLKVVRLAEALTRISDFVSYSSSWLVPPIALFHVAV